MRLAQRRRKKYAWLGFSGFVFLIIIYAGAGWVSANDKIEINTVIIQGNKVVSASKLENTVKQGLAVTRALLLYGGTIFTYNKDAIINDLLYKYPRLESVEIQANNIDTIKVSVTERETVALWCANFKDDLEMRECYLLDKDGFAFEKAVINVMEKYFEKFVIYTGDAYIGALRKQLLHGEFSNVHTFVKNIQKEIGLDIKTVLLTKREMEIYSNSYPTLKVKLDDDFDRVLSYIKITLNSKEYKEYMNSQKSGKRINYEKNHTYNKDQESNYIDLRFGNRIYYK